MEVLGESQRCVSIYHLFVCSAPTSKTHSSKNAGGFESFLHPQIILIALTFIVAIKTTYRNIDCGKTHCRQRIKNLKPVNMTNSYTEINTNPILS